MHATDRQLGRISLRWRLVILVLVAAAPLQGLLIAGTVADRNLVLANARTQSMELARLGAERQADAIQQARELLSVMRRMPDLNAAAPEACHTIVGTIAADHPQFNTIGLVDGDGMVRCHNLITKHQAFADPDLFRQVVEPKGPPFVISKFRIGKVSGKPTVVMASPLPDGPDGRPTGMVFASLNLDSFARTADELAGQDNRAVLVIDPRTGTLLARAHDQDHLVGRNFVDHPLVRALVASPQGGVIETDGLAGVPRIFGFAPLPGVGRDGPMIAVGLSRAEVLASANSRFLIGIFIAGLATIGALGAAWLFSESAQIKPIRGLVVTAERLGQGDLTARCNLEPWQAPEFRKLAATLNEMARAISAVQRNLQDSQAELRLLADNSTDMVFMLDRDGRRTYISPSCREILGFQPDELLGTKPVSMIHQDDAEQVAKAYNGILISGSERATVVNRIRHRDGHWVWVEANMRTLRDPESGDSIGMLGALRDISSRKLVEDKLAAANERLKLLASRDALTGLPNRRSFDDFLDQEWRRAAREGVPLGLVMLDVDRFKAYNDAYGHQAGDDCLCIVSRAIERALLRPADFGARYGGEEFVVILPGADKLGTIEVAERIRRAVETADIVHRGNPGGVVTISAGAICLAAIPRSLTPRDALEAADKNLYAAKASGRNCVVYDTVDGSDDENDEINSASDHHTVIAA